MANFSPVLNTTGLIYSHDGGIVLRSTYLVYELYVNHLGDQVIDLWMPGEVPSMEFPCKGGGTVRVETLDVLATAFSDGPGMAVSLVNKHPDAPQEVTIPLEHPMSARVYTVNGPDKDSYNDVDRTEVTTMERSLGVCDHVSLTLPPHSVTLIEMGRA